MPFKFENKKAQGSAEIKKAVAYLKRYVVMLIAIYVGFVVMTEWTGVFEADQSVRYIEIMLAGTILTILGVVIYKLIHGIRLLKEDETK